MKNIAIGVKTENKYRANFLKKFANILPDFFIPDLKNLLPETLDMATLLAFDKNLPQLSNLHNPLDVALAEGSVVGSVNAMPDEENAETKLRLDSLEAERRDLRAKTAEQDLRLSSMRVEMLILKEKVG